MPAELLRDVCQPHENVRGPRFSMLPLSIAAHAIVALAVLIIPLAAEVDLPTPARLSGPSFLKARALPTPPPPPSAGRPVTVGRTVAPTEAPTTIARERDTEPAGVPTPGAIPDFGSVTPGVPGGLGTTFEPSLPPPAPPQLLRAGQGVQVPRKILNVAPIYPVVARNVRVEGQVILEAVINERGTVERIKVLKSVMLLDAAAIDAVKQWRYTPTLLNGIPVSVLMTITVQFSLHD